MYQYYAAEAHSGRFGQIWAKGVDQRSRERGRWGGREGERRREGRGGAAKHVQCVNSRGGMGGFSIESLS